MKIGVPKEVKTLEGRVGLVPEACAELVKAGHQVFVEQGAGRLSGYSDEAYQQAGVELIPDAAGLYGEAELVIKVKEPQQQEWATLEKIIYCSAISISQLSLF